MQKVFLVEDEVVVREGLRNSVPWEQYGFEYVGGASDGEMALPMIRQLKPDLLITDIKMPFMDGLSLCSFVRKELPKTRIIILSGYDDFKYAQQAISMGVEQYLLKPVSKAKMIEVLCELRRKIDEEQQQNEYNDKFRMEAQEYEQYSRRNFFEQLVGGGMTAQEIYEGAERLGIGLDAQSYNIVLLSVRGNTEGAGLKPGGADDIQEALMRLFLRCPEYLPFRWNLTTCAVLIKGAPETVEAMTESCIERISRSCEQSEGLAWYVTRGTPVARLSALSSCFAEASRIMACSYLCPEEHILTQEHVDILNGRSFGSSIDEFVIDTEKLRGFLAEGTTAEIGDFVSAQLGESADNLLNSVVFCQYFCMTVRVTAQEYLESINVDTKEFLKAEKGLVGSLDSAEGARRYVRLALRRAIELRQQAMTRRYKDLIQKAILYIENNFSDKNLSLGSVAGVVGLSQNYFSALFSQEVGQTFVEYLTARRMKEACRLLRDTRMSSSDITEAVGYNDPHYFSFLFKKTQGCTPREYRGGERS